MSNYNRSDEKPEVVAARGLNGAIWDKYHQSEDLHKKENPDFGDVILDSIQPFSIGAGLTGLFLTVRNAINSASIKLTRTALFSAGAGTVLAVTNHWKKTNPDPKFEHTYRKSQNQLEGLVKARDALDELVGKEHLDKEFEKIPGKHIGSREDNRWSSRIRDEIRLKTEEQGEKNSIKF